MGKLAEYGTAAEFRDIIRTIVDERVNKLRPATRIAEVVEINALQLVASVKFAGDKGSFRARFGLSLVPRAVGNLVRVAGSPGNYWITEILNDSGVHNAYEPIKEAVDTGVIPTQIGVDQQIALVYDDIQNGDTANQQYIDQQITGVQTGVNNAIKGYVNEYSVNSSETVAPTTGWSTTQPVRTPGTFIWFRTVVTRGDNSTSTTTPALLTGNAGAQGGPGTPAAVVTLTATAQVLVSPATGGATTPTTATVTGTATNTTIDTYEYSVDSGTFVTTPVPAGVSRTGNVVTITGSTMTARTIAVRMRNASIATATDTLTVAKVSNGSDGGPGAAGRGISSTTVTYAKNTSGITPPSSGSFTSSIPATIAGEYLWTRTYIVYTDATNSESFSVAAHGATGGPGNDGRGISGTTVEYNKSTDGVTPPGSGWTASIPTTVANEYLWTRTVITYTSGIPATTTSHSVAKHGTSGTNGTDGYTALLTNEAMTFPGSTTAALGGSQATQVVGYKGATQQTVTIGTITGQTTGQITAAVTGSPGTSPTVTVTVTTSLTAQSGTLVVPVQFDGKTFNKEISWSVARQGAAGGPGAAAPTITSVLTYYLQTTDPAGAPAKPTASTPPGWSTTQPAWAANTKLWRTDRVGFSDASFTYTDVAQDQSYAAALFATTSANGKNSITHSQAAPGTASNTLGDTWFQYADAPLTKLTRVWRGAGGTSWTQGTMDTTIIPLLDIGVATFGSMSGGRIAAQSMQVDRLLVSSFDNLLSDSMFKTSLTDANATWQNQSYLSIVANAGRVTTEPALRITNTTAQNTTYNLPYDMNKIEQGQWLRLNCFVKPSVAAGANTINMVIRWKSITGTFTYSTVTLRNSAGTAIAYTSGAWNLVEGKVQAPANTDSWSMYLETTTGLTTGTVDFYNPQVTRAASAEMIVDGAIRAIHITADMVNGLIVTGGVIQTNLNGSAYGTTPTGIKMNTTGLTGYSSAGVANFQLSASTGEITAVGSITTAAANGTSVRLNVSANAFETGQNWAVIDFTTGMGTNWASGMLWGWDNGTNEGALRLASPHYKLAAGTDPYFKSAVLDLRGKLDGSTSALLHADLFEMRGNSFQVTSPDGSAADFNILGTDFLQFQPKGGSNRLAVYFGTLGTVEVRARDQGNGQKRLILDGSTVEFVPQGAGNLQVSADAAGNPWFGRANQVSGFRFNNTNELSAREYSGTLIAVRASSFPTGSDGAWKDNQAILKDASKLVAGIDPYTWKWNALTNSDMENKKGLGFIAQHVQKMIPEAVSGVPVSDGGDGLGVDPLVLLGVLWGAFKEHLADCAALPPRGDVG